MIVMVMKSSSQWWIGLIALAIGILILFLTKSITLIADGNIKQVKIATKSLLGASDNAYHLMTSKKSSSKRTDNTNGTQMVIVKIKPVLSLFLTSIMDIRKPSI